MTGWLTGISGGLPEFAKVSSARGCWTDNNNGLRRRDAWWESSGGVSGESSDEQVTQLVEGWIIAHDSDSDYH
jgi:hypothetical protein